MSLRNSVILREYDTNQEIRHLSCLSGFPTAAATTHGASLAEHITQILLHSTGHPGRCVTGGRRVLKPRYNIGRDGGSCCLLPSSRTIGHEHDECSFALITSN